MNGPQKRMIFGPISALHIPHEKSKHQFRWALWVQNVLAKKKGRFTTAPT